MKGSIALGWLLSTVIFALLGNAGLTVAFFFFAVAFSLLTLNNEYTNIKGYATHKLFQDLEKENTDER